MTFKEMLNLSFEEFIGKLCEVDYDQRSIHSADMLIIEIFDKAKERRSLTRWEHQVLELILVSFNKV